ncbi:MAG: hypothetical protein HY762_07590 [Planctomycetes bacterium]|nr:hypothetical protein [Planctomycetota bacterium]
METLEKDLVIVSAAVHAYLNSLAETTDTQRSVRFTQMINPCFPVLNRGSSPKLGRWKLSFFPHINPKGHRDTYHGRGHRPKW